MSSEQDSKAMAERYREDISNRATGIGKRMQAVFHLRTQNTVEAVNLLLDGLKQKGDSVLLRHEIAFVLGQMQNDTAVKGLCAILEDVDDDPVVRHEAAEALGAIGCESVLESLKKYCDDGRREVSETCKIAVRRLEWKIKHGKDSEPPEEEEKKYLSVDPAPPESEKKTIPELENALLDTSLPLFERYRAMFSLRNEGSEASVLALAKGLHDDSALFRHEIAYVLGQMEHPASVPALRESLCNLEEHGMVRHEAAEALGAIGTEECIGLLKIFQHDKVDIVRDSCLVALETFQYWQNFGTSTT